MIREQGCQCWWGFIQETTNLGWPGIDGWGTEMGGEVEEILFDRIVKFQRMMDAWRERKNGRRKAGRDE